MKVLLIHWLDHQSLSGWIGTHEAVAFCSQNPLEAVSVGFEVYQDDEVIVLAQSVAGGADITGDLLKVMKNCITSMKTIYTEK